MGKTEGVAIVEWEASPAGDVIADAMIALLMHAQSSAASIRLTSKPCRHPRPNDNSNDQVQEPTTKKSRSEESLVENRLRLIKDTLKEQFELVDVVYEGPTATFEITLDTGLESNVMNEDGSLTCTAKVAFGDEEASIAEITVECTDNKLASNVRDCLRNLAATLAPVPC